MKVSSSEVELYAYKSTIRRFTNYCSYFCADAPDCYLNMLNKLKKHVSRSIGPSLTASFEPLAHHRNLVSLRTFHRYFFGRYTPEMTELVPLSYSYWRSTCYSNRLHGSCHYI